MKKKILCIMLCFNILFMTVGCGKEDVLKVESESDYEDTANSKDINTDEKTTEEELSNQENLGDKEENAKPLLIQKELVYIAESSGELTFSETWDYIYDSQGNLIKLVAYDEDGERTKSFGYEYNNQGNISKEIHYNGHEDVLEWCDYIYDEQGILLQLESRAPGRDEPIVRKYIYDNQGNTIRRDLISDDGNVYAWIEYVYDAQGNILKELTCYDWDTKRSYLVEYKYNEQGLLESEFEYSFKEIKDMDDTEEINTVADYRNDYTYDSQGNLMECTRYKNDIIWRKQVYEYATPEELGIYLGESQIEESNENEDSVISGYSVIRDDFSRSTDNGRQIEMYFDKVIFEGSDDTIYWLNGQIESLEATYRKDYEKYMESDLINLQEFPYDSAWSYSPRELNSVYYDDNYVSIGWSGLWYAGGVTDTEFACMNYDLNSKSELTLHDILGENAYDIIVDALDKEDDSGWLSSSFDYSMIDKALFYFDESTVYVNLPDLDVNWTVSISISR